ncbi:hypothetical protein BDN70DRAFT_873479 [Pholiota conissans]|uniref:Uncharacterized protein n=1 Tax=Pholiota conissans TaxID=109636 RepID=A0A9P6D525_9AGAR|nr:hypothetical protein BDN70DRAFT_873479 [Pholiota conissans]
MSLLLFYKYGGSMRGLLDLILPLLITTQTDFSRPAAPQSNAQMSTLLPMDFYFRQLQQGLETYKNGRIQLERLYNFLAEQFVKDGTMTNMNTSERALWKECQNVLLYQPIDDTTSPSDHSIDQRAVVPLEPRSTHSHRSAQDEQNAMNVVDSTVIEDSDGDDSGQYLDEPTSDSNREQWKPNITPSSMLTKPLLWHPRVRVASAQRFSSTPPPSNDISSNGSSVSIPKAPLPNAQRKLPRRLCYSSAESGYDGDEDQCQRRDLSAKHRSNVGQHTRDSEHRHMNKHFTPFARSRPVSGVDCRDVVHATSAGLHPGQTSSSTISSTVAPASTRQSPPLSLPVDHDRPSLKRARNPAEDAGDSGDGEDRRPIIRIKIRRDATQVPRVTVTTYFKEARRDAVRSGSPEMRQSEVGA